MTVQEHLESALQVLNGEPVEVVGCGRTDAGVHASDFYAHFDTDKSGLKQWPYKLNAILPSDIAVQDVIPVDEDAHARYSATKREYTYRLINDKSPFYTELAFHYNKSNILDENNLQAAASILLNYHSFAPFCKTSSDVSNTDCEIFHSEWIKTPTGWEYHIAANRFLRGMVRLIVGMCLQLATGNVLLDDVKAALDNQTSLKRPWSVPAHGLYLAGAHYPFKL